jgi:type I restriction enzyme, S subunit
VGVDHSVQWPIVVLGEMSADDDGAVAIGPFGSSMRADTYTASGIPVVRGNNLNGRPGFHGEFVFVDEATAARFHRCIIRPGDLVFPHRGAIGEVGLAVGQPPERWLLSTSMMKFRPAPAKLDHRYLFYFFRSIAGRYELLKNASQVGTPGISQPLTSLRAIEVPLPPLSEQRAIAQVLESLDDKIDHNRRTSQTLERLARSIFRAWFADFEPVKAKAAGKRSFPGMPPAVFDELRGRLVDSGVGPIPAGWDVKELGSVAEASKGLSYKGAGLVTDPDLTAGVMPLHNLNSIYEGGGYKNEGIKYYSGEYKPRHVLEAGDLIVANTEQGFEYRLIGFPAIVPRRFGPRGLFTHHIYRVHPTDPNRVGRFFLYHALMTGRVREEVIGCTNGTTVNMLAVDGLQRPHLCIPPAPVSVAFEQTARGMHELQESLHEESRKLAKLRDYLLPKLLSGEVRVKGEAAVFGPYLRQN